MYVKLFGSILDSSIWEEGHATVRLWITMLAMANEYGMVEASISGLGHRARVTPMECNQALKILTEPDLDSKDQSYGGRRVEKVDGGWLLLNYEKYREMRSKKQVMDAARQARRRKKVREEERDTSRDGVTGHDVTVEAEAEAEAEAEHGSKGKRTTLPMKRPTKANAIVATNVTETLHQLVYSELRRSDLLTAQAFALFAYWVYITKMRQATTQLTTDRLSRLEKHIKQRGLNFCLYVVDGGIKHPHLNRAEGKNWELDSFFPLNNADRLEKLVRITKFEREPVHPWIQKHPELGGGHE